MLAEHVLVSRLVPPEGIVSGNLSITILEIVQIIQFEAEDLTVDVVDVAH
jgi:hypothetical protein